jgi:expansin (peptidoglycan-binding protein)
MHFSTFVLTSLAAGYATALSGKSTFYGGNVNGGTCSFSTYTLPSGLEGTAISQQNWEGSQACGGCIEVTGPEGKKVKAMVCMPLTQPSACTKTKQIVDKCPECATNALDLFQTAFVKLDDVSKGIIDVTWDYVDCGISTPLQIHMKEGVSAFWFSAQAVNANKVCQYSGLKPISC